MDATASEDRPAFRVFGAGAMGTACAVVLARNGHPVRLVCRSEDAAKAIAETRTNERHLPGVELPAGVDVTSGTPGGEGPVMVAVPSRHLRAYAETLRQVVTAGTPVVSVVKGIEEETLCRPSEILADVLGTTRFCVLGGPSHAEEIARRQPTTVVAASGDADFAEDVQAAFSNPDFRVYTNDDPLGVELAGALKNVVGLAAGINDGHGFGDNAKAALLTRAIVEMRRFGEALGAKAETFSGLAGVGDLIATCVSVHGRNRAVGERIGRGEKLADITASTNSVAEGVTTARSVAVLAERHGVDMPIVQEVCAVLFEGKPPGEAATDLMTRPPRPEGAGR